MQLRFPRWDLWLTFQKLKLHIFACNVDRDKLQMSSLCEKLVIDSIMFCDYNLGSYFNQIQSFSKKYGIGLFLVKTISPLSNWHLWINYFFFCKVKLISQRLRSPDVFADSSHKDFLQMRSFYGFFFSKPICRICANITKPPSRSQPPFNCTFGSVDICSLRTSVINFMIIVPQM